MEDIRRSPRQCNKASDNHPHELRPSKVQIIRRLSMETFMVRVYAGPLSQECDFVAVEAEKATPAMDIVQVACRKMRLQGSWEKYELAEVFSSGGQLCKERRLEDMDNPVGIQLLWPKVINAEVDRGLGLFTGYRFYIRLKDPEVSRCGWVEVNKNVVDTFLLSFLQQPVGAKEYQDLCNLPDLNEQTLLHNLKARFNASKIYTYVGTILIAVNPFRFFPIYNPRYVKMYQKKRLGELPPHIFAIADAAYFRMLQMRQNQCIVISGESGSGKTESTNLLLHHLTALSHKGLHGSGVEQTILGAGPVLEAFGNAKTVHNNNSSRFGKFIQVNYKENGMVHGAVMEKYLLEKSRIVSQAKNERNYHVFYYLLAGADDREREALGLTKPEHYQYLAHSECCVQEGLDEEHEFARLKQSMEMVGFSAETQRKIFGVLSAVLHLGNVEFIKKGDQHHDESVVVKNEATVKMISHLLKVKERTVLEALTQKKSTAGDETFTINYKMEDAVATRNAMAKCIYGALFDWIVLKVNQALLVKKHNSEHEGNSIGVLDIFGFEDFGRNSFEQLCINYANEHLQYYFNQHIFKFEQEEYQREGIQWKNIEFIDNTGCLEIFSKLHSGLFYLLDEECNFPGATNDTLLSKFTHNHRGNPYYQVPQLKEGAFNIVHYAGKVKYCVKDFREKNSDLVRPEIVSTMKNSSMAFVRELMGIDPVAVLRWSVVRTFFQCFFAFISAGRRYRTTGGAEAKARKRKSDSHRHESVISEKLIKQRERSLAASALASLNETEKFTMDGSDLDLVCSRRHDLHEELMMYSSMESNLPPSDAQVIRRARQLLMKKKSLRTRPGPALSLRDVKALKALAGGSMLGGVRMSSKKQPPSVSAQFQWSLSRLMTTLNHANPYFIRCIKSNADKAPCQFDDEIVLRQLRYTGMLATVKIRQSGYNYRLLFEEFIQLYQILLPHGMKRSRADVQSFLLSMKLNMDNCQIGKTKVFLRESEKLLLDEALHTAIMRRVVFIQRWFKSRLQRRYFLQLQVATLNLQKHARRWLAQRLLHRLQSEQDAAITVQRVYRGWRVRRAYRAYREAVIFLQCLLRAFLTRRRFLLALNEKRVLEEQQHRRHLEQEEERTRQRRLREELQSTGSDEGVMMKGSSAEELEDRGEFSPRLRPDSEDRSSGILEDSDTEPSAFPSASGGADSSLTVKSRREAYLVEAEHTRPDGRVHGGSYSYRQSASGDETDGRTYFVRRGSERFTHKRTPAPLARGESISDLDTTPQREDVSSEDKLHPRGLVLSPDHQQKMEDIFSKGKPPQQEKEAEESSPLPSEQGSHLSPLRKAHKTIKNIMGDFREAGSCGASHHFLRHTRNSFRFFRPRSSRRKKDPTESDEEPEDIQPLPAVSPHAHKMTEMGGVLVLPGLAMSAAQAGKGDGEKGGVAHQVPRAKRKKKQPRSRSHSADQRSPGASQTQSNVKISGTSEWQYSEDLKITDIHDLIYLDEFISQKCRDLFKDGARIDTVFDKIFKGALDEFGKELKTVTAIEMQHADVVVKYRDLFEKFRNVLKAEMRKTQSQAEQTEAPLVMALNAFRGFLDEFMKQQSGRRREKKEERSKPEKPVKRDKHKKDTVVEHLGHKFLQVQFNIPTFCEYCSSLIWLMDKGQMCQVCKYACHRKCSVKTETACRGTSTGQSPSTGRVFGASLERLVKDGDKIPPVVERLINAIEMQGLYTVGLYRKCGAAPKVRELRALIEKDYQTVNLEEYPVHVLTAVMKGFLRDLPEPLLTYDLYDDFLRGSEIKDQREQAQCLFSIVEKLPRPNYHLFERLTFHLAKVAMHEDSTKMSVNGLAIIFAPCLLRSNKTIQAQESLNQVPKQTSCIEVILAEELDTVKSKLADISMLESAEQTAEERLSHVRASLRDTKMKADMRSSVRRQMSVQEDEEETDSAQDPELAAEAWALSAHIASMHKERKKLTSKLPILETRQASSDEDVLTGDETDSMLDLVDACHDNQDEDPAAFDLPANPPFLRHFTKGRVPIPTRRHPPLRHSGGKGGRNWRSSNTDSGLSSGIQRSFSMEGFTSPHVTVTDIEDRSRPRGDNYDDVDGGECEDDREIMV
ncbi:unconventional myosin-IXb-like isoform X3 [Babylonia areolata]|uniref:unconventional myosin-IXb-like isoform X3 n=1 Tax=Babylonia areolata TaxID=304850 RepID=UPI003FD67FDA